MQLKSGALEVLDEHPTFLEWLTRWISENFKTAMVLPKGAELSGERVLCCGKVKDV